MGRGQAEHSKALIRAAHDILSEIHPATVRAVCYKLFAQGLIDSMAKNNTNKISRLLSRARKDEDIPWEWIVDETRSAEIPPTWRNPKEYVEACKCLWRLDRWEYQDVHVEVWSEKGTVRGLLQPILREYQVTFRVFHGYTSTTCVHDVAEQSLCSEKKLIALYVGDWDPSGLQMSDEDLPNRSEEHKDIVVRQRNLSEKYDGIIELRRIALVQSDLAGLPRFPVNDKKTDPRWNGFVKKSAPINGPWCWELDALDPRVLRQRVADAIEREIDWEAWERSARCEQAGQESLITALDTWHNGFTHKLMQASQ